MNINRTQSVNFKGIVHLRRMEEAQNPVLRPLIEHLKHHSGSKRVHHFIDINSENNAIEIIESVYITKPIVNGVKKHSRILGNGSLNEPASIDKLINLIDATKIWFRDIRMQEKINLKDEATQLVGSK